MFNPKSSLFSRDTLSYLKHEDYKNFIVSLYENDFFKDIEIPLIKPIVFKNE
jgi:hypothetical protein